MNKKNLRRVSFLLSLVVLVGGFFVYSEIFFLWGFILLAVSFTGIILIWRYLNSLPPDEKEIRGWQTIKAQGKNQYLLRSLKYGLFLTVIFVGFYRIENLFYGKPLLEGLGRDLIIALVLLIFLPVYTGWEMWKFNEQRFYEAKKLAER
jgi:hypothetical protein